MALNWAEGLRRVFKVLGITMALTIVAAGYFQRPSQERVQGSAVHQVLTLVGENAARSEGRDRPWYAYDIQSAWYKDWSDAAILEKWCGKDALVADARITKECAVYRQQLSSLWWDNAKHFGEVFGGAALAYAACTLLGMLLIWIGRGFTTTTGSQS